MERSYCTGNFTAAYRALTSQQVPGMGVGAAAAVGWQGRGITVRQHPPT